MARAAAVVAEDGVIACAREDAARVVALLAELTSALDVSHPAAHAVCRVYEDALAGAHAGRFVTARALFQALREA